MNTSTTKWHAFPETNTIGDPGRQPEVRSVPGPLSVGVCDTALDFLTIGPFELRACSSRGWSHRAAGTPRQDAFALLATDDLVVVAVADGVSQGQHSQVAAETAARSACKLAADQVARSGAVDWDQLARRISLRIIEEAEYRQLAPQPAPDASTDDRLRGCLAQMATTLIVGVVWRTPTHDGFPAVVGVVAGDSAAYRWSPDRLLPLGGGKDGGPVTSTAVRPLPGAVQPEAIPLHLQPGDALVLGTDGIGDPVGDGTNDVGQELARRWAEPPTIDQFLMDVNFYRRTFDDDRTAVGFWVWPGVELPEEVMEPAEPSEDAGAAGPAVEADEPTAPGPDTDLPAESAEPQADDLTALIDVTAELGSPASTPSTTASDDPSPTSPAKES